MTSAIGATIEARMPTLRCIPCRTGLALDGPFYQTLDPPDAREGLLLFPFGVRALRLSDFPERMIVMELH
jgi:hypothetical protein